MAALKLTVTQQCPISIQPVDARGNPARVDGDPVWTNSNPEVLTLVVDPGGLSALARATGPIGTSQIGVTADADLGEGVITLSGTLDVEVGGAQAVGITITPGTPTEQP
jgi:hypothetical protein